jgi:hypothetical protein
MSETCAYHGCDDSADVERKFTPEGTERAYCSNHDPVTDCRVAGFVEL